MTLHLIMQDTIINFVKNNFMEAKIMKILVTGVAGFIGSNLVKKLLRNENNLKIVGIDNMNNYYDV